MQNAKHQTQALDSLQHIVNSWIQLAADPYIIARMIDKKRKTSVVLEEVWPADEPYNNSSSTLDNMVAWVTTELEKLPTVRRTAWDTWEFNTRREAERFVIMYNLKWTR